MKESLEKKGLLKKQKTALTWKNLLLNKREYNKVKDLEKLLKNKEIINSKTNSIALFHGPPGTGKTLTASLLGKYTNHDVYRIDLSLVVSKFIGETEKHMDSIFNTAKNKNWILFFDEADALFGKRTEVNNAHDKYANQEVSYLLQRIENYSGLVIFSTNFKNNIDDAFLRRFHTVIEYKRLSFIKRMVLRFKKNSRT